MTQTAIGLAIGLPLALLASRGLSSQLYGVTSHDPVVISTAVAVLVIAGIVASIVPARRAATIDPIKALKNE
jgi:ABC-type antimicrobial peptide transport system permease subunit